VEKHRLLRNTGMVAPFVIDGAVNREVFELHVERILVPELRRGDIVVMDNLSSHKGPAVRTMIRGAGARVLHFNPIEKAFSKLKAALRKAAQRTVDGLWDTIGVLVDTFTPSECANDFAACGYDAD
jgi:transposase